MILSPWYGFDRDERYFYDCARHLSASYVGFFAIAVTVGALLSRGWAMPANRWFVAGAILAVGFTVPDLI
jgi:hypothetical protein